MYANVGESWTPVCVCTCESLSQRERERKKDYAHAGIQHFNINVKLKWFDNVPTRVICNTHTHRIKAAGTDIHTQASNKVKRNKHSG